MALNPEELYGVYHASATRRERLRDDMVRKALNLPAGEDDTNVHVNQGLGWRAVAAIVLGVLGSGIAGSLLTRLSSQRPPAEVREMESQEYRLIWEAEEDGVEVDVQREK